MIRTHQLKTWPAPFKAVLEGAKVHEIRVDDRGFAVGDKLLLLEYEPNNGFARGNITDRWLEVEVTYKSEAGTWGLPATLCVMSIKLLRSGETYGGWSLP